MTTIRLDHTLKQLKRDIKNIQTKQVPFAASLALNNAMFKTRKVLRGAAIKFFDRPTKFTVNAFQVKKTTKRRLIGAVFIEPKRAKYLKINITGGGVVYGGKFGHAIPTLKARLNRHGNIPGKKTGLVKSKNQFIVTKNVKRPGVYERRGGKNDKHAELIYGFHRNAMYKRKFPFKRLTLKSAVFHFRREFPIAYARAINSAR